MTPISIKRREILLVPFTATTFAVDPIDTLVRVGFLDPELLFIVDFMNSPAFIFE